MARTQSPIPKRIQRAVESGVDFIGRESGNDFLAEIPDKIHLLSPLVTEATERFKKDILKFKKVGLDLEETLIALCMCAATNPTAQLAMEKLKEFRGCEIHMTHIPPPGDEGGLRRLGVNLTSDAEFFSKNLIVR